MPHGGSGGDGGPGAACKPIPHPSTTVREQPGSAARFRLLSGNGRYVVVTASAASAAVPGPGTWRVDRTTGAAVALATTAAPVRASADGSRILFGTESDPLLWVGGAFVVPPSGVLAEDLGYALYRAGDGTIARWRSADGQVTPVEVGAPRPPATTAAAPTAVSDDGQVVSYRLTVGGAYVQRFVDLARGTVVDSPTGQQFALAGSGERFARLSTTPGGGGWVELVAVADGQVVRRHDDQSGEALTSLRIGRRGDTVWAHRQRTGSTTQGTCPPVQSPIPLTCVVASSLVAISSWGASVYPLGPGFLRSFDIDRGGRFALVDQGRNPFVASSRDGGPTRVVDRSTDQVEVLDTAAPPYTETDAAVCFGAGRSAPCTLPAYATDAQMSDDQRLVATTSRSGAGWYEFAAVS